MGSSDQVDIEISEDLVRSIIEAKVHTAIVESLASEKGVVERVVSAALCRKVSEDGSKPDRYEKSPLTYMEYLCRRVISQAAEAAIARWAEERQDVLEAEFLKQLQAKKTASAMVRACVDGLQQAAKCGWRFQVVFPDER